MNLKLFVRNVAKAAAKHSQTIMACGAVLGVAGTVILTYKKAGKIHDIISEQKEKVNDVEENDELTEEEVKQERKEITRETVKRLAPEVAPIAGCALATTGLVIGSVVTANMKISSLASLLGISEAYNREITDKTKELVGEEKAREIQDAVIDDHLDKALGDEKIMPTVINAKGGGDLFYDESSGRLFYSDIPTVKDAVSTVNDQLSSGAQDWMSLNEIYRELDIPRIDLAEHVGAGDWCETKRFELYLRHAKLLDCGKAAIVFDFWKKPSPREKSK